MGQRPCQRHACAGHDAEATAWHRDASGTGPSAVVGGAPVVLASGAGVRCRRAAAAGDVPYLRAAPGVDGAPAAMGKPRRQARRRHYHGRRCRRDGWLWLWCWCRCGCWRDCVCQRPGVVRRGGNGAAASSQDGRARRLPRSPCPPRCRGCHDGGCARHRGWRRHDGGRGPAGDGEGRRRAHGARRHAVAAVHAGRGEPATQGAPRCRHGCAVA